MFCDTGLEFPEIREFVKSIDNVTWLKPEMNYKTVIKQYGYPIITKRVADAIHFGSKPGTSRWNMLHGNAPARADGKPSEFDYRKYAYLLDAPFKVSAKCCDIMKKNPLKKYSKESGRVPIIGTMASESRARKSQWIKEGCNMVSGKEPSSRPLSFWTENDILQYILKYDVPYCSIYGSIVSVGGLSTTGAERTGCMFCGFGCHREKEPNRFQMMKETHPKIYDFCMKPIENGGLGMDEVLNYIGVPH